MSAYRFESISVQDAAAFASADTLQFGAGAASQASVAYGGDGSVTIAFGGRSMAFGAGIVGQTGTRFADGSMLYVGGTGADTVVGTAFGDGLYGGAEADVLDAGDGADLLQGNQGADTLIGGLGADVIYGGQDNDQIRVSAANSTRAETNFANGNRGDDAVIGGASLDTLLGGQGDDFVSGGDGGDFVNGNLGDDILNGDGGEDTLLGEGGADILTGGEGADLFVFAAGSSSAATGQTDSIFDWSSIDRIHIEGARAGFASVSVPQTPGYSYGGYFYPPTQGDESFASLLSLANNTLAANAGVGVVAVTASFSVVVFADVDGDRQADLAITLSGTSAADVTASNFV